MIFRISEQLDAFKEYTKKHRWEAVALMISSVVLAGLITFGGINLFSPQALDIFRIPSQVIHSLRSLTGVATMLGVGGIGFLLGGGLSLLLKDCRLASTSESEDVSENNDVGTPPGEISEDNVVESPYVSDPIVTIHLIRLSLIQAVKNGDLDHVKTLLKKYEDSKPQDQQDTLIKEYEKYKHKDLQKVFVLTVYYHVGPESDAILQTLLDSGVSINAKNDDEDSALHMAVQCENVDLIRHLLTKNIDVNIRNNIGLTAPESALSNPKQPDIAISIIESGRISREVLMKMQEYDYSKYEEQDRSKILDAIQNALDNYEPSQTTT